MRIIMICILLLCIATPAEARTRFGTEDKIIRIQKIEVPAAARQMVPPEFLDNAYLARRISIKWFIGGAYLTDHGYIIELADDRYFDLGTERTSALQTIGVLPTPLPTAPIPTSYYVMGYSLWPVLGFILISATISIMIRNRRSRRVRAVVGSSFPELLRQTLIGAAKADGKIDPEEIKLIAEIMSKITNAKVRETSIMQDIDHSTLKGGDLLSHIEMIGPMMNPVQRQIMIRELYRVIAVDGKIDRKEKVMLDSCAKSLMLTSAQLKEITAKL